MDQTGSPEGAEEEGGAMYPHSALVGGGTRNYYPNAIAQEVLGPSPAGRKRRMRTAVASILLRRVPSRTPSPHHPSVMARTLAVSGSTCRTSSDHARHVA